MKNKADKILMLQSLASGKNNLSILLPQRLPIVIYTDGQSFTTTNGEPISNEQLAKNKNPVILCYNGGSKIANAESEIDGSPWDASKQYYPIQQ